MSVSIGSSKCRSTMYIWRCLPLDSPGARGRAGKAEDTENFVSLVKEMRNAFGTALGISATLPASY